MGAWDEQEWSAFCGLVEESWKDEFDDVAAQAWQTVLEGFAPDVVTGAVRQLLLKGGTWRPSLADVLATIREDPSRPTFDEAYALIFGSRGILRAPVPYTGPRVGDGLRVAKIAAMRARAADCHPLVAAFVERQGFERLQELNVDEPVWGERARRELKVAWDAHVEAFEGREVAALAGRSGRRDLPQAFDPLAVLGIGQRPALEAGS